MLFMCETAFFSASFIHISVVVCCYSLLFFLRHAFLCVSVVNNNGIGLVACVAHESAHITKYLLLSLFVSERNAILKYASFLYILYFVAVAR